MKTVFTFIIVIFAINGFCQAPEIEWQNTIGGDREEYLSVIKETIDNGYIIGGSSRSTASGDKTEDNWDVTFPYLHDIWVVKTNSLGVVEWENTIGSFGDDILFSLDPTFDGGYIIGATTGIGISGDKTEGNFASTDFWVIKLNSFGIIEWQNVIGGSSHETDGSLLQTSDGGFMLAGSSGSGISGDKTEEIVGSYDFWIIKLNVFGAIEWQNTIGGNLTDYIKDIKETQDGGYIMTGDSNSGISGDKHEGPKGLQDFWVVKVNSAGIVEWENTIGGNSTDEGRSINCTIDGGYIVGGISMSGISFDKTEMNLGEIDYWLIKLDSGGNIEWQKTIGGDEDDQFSVVDITSDMGFIVGGTSGSDISGNKTVNSNLNQYWILKLDYNGEIMWQRGVDGSNMDYLDYIKQTSDLGYILGGHSQSNINLDKTENCLGEDDYWIVKLFPDCTPTPELCNSLDDNCNGLIDDAITETISISAGGPITFCQGGNVLLTATYSGATVQWKKNGVNIPGATSPTYLVNIKGAYTCVTTSACGTALSSPILVNVIKNPPASITAGGATTFCAGGSVILTANAGGGLSYQWYKGASLIAGATSINYTATLAGNYKCRVTKTATGCFKNSNVIGVSVPCKEGDEFLEPNIIIYPNPASQMITINFTGNTGVEKNVKIYDVLGQKCFDANVKGDELTIDIKLYSNGIYFLHTEFETISTSLKFIKE